MLNAIPKQVMTFTKFSRLSFILRLLLGGWFAFMSQPNLAQAQTNNQTNNNGVFIAQRRPSVYDGVPPAPSIMPSIMNEPLPSLPSNPEGYTTREVNTSSQRVFDFQAQPYRYNQDYAPYKVYVSNSDYRSLQQVRRLSPGAFRQQFRGRSVIQIGAFRTENGARNLARQLDFDGVRTAVVYNNRVVYRGQNRREVPYDSDRGDYNRDRSSSYYVVIPTKLEELSYYSNAIRRYVGRNAYVIPRDEPRGPHVAVGPFVKRWQAEEWNDRLRDRGFGNARVYYGK
ncbi:hypothetical protein BZZ01_07550 [Nostocales cyanobacterium HT-58-2]|nr:hypothetical protein BZZ01_07550 [Nostocales cyanobacterium HT-58-2]